jgi:peptide/nickel transport system permease protein
MLRAGVAEAMASDYVQAARLNGIPERRIIVSHALRNALAPTVQVVALTVQWLVGGIVVVETVFSYPGLGQGLVQAVTARDIPVVQSLTLLIAAFYIMVNLVADIIVILLVPKLRTSL